MIVNQAEFPPLPSQMKRTRRLDSQSRPSAKKATSFATANDLPDELLLQILDYLPCHDLKNFNLPTIISLSLTSRRLHYIVEDKLYAAYNSFFATPYLFLRTCGNNRQISQRVKSLDFSYGLDVHADRKRFIPSVTDRRELKGALKALEIPGWKDWATDCNDEMVDMEILYAAILMFTPNVTSLYIDDGDLPYQTPKWLNVIHCAVSGIPFGHMHQFSYLKSIRVDIGALNLRSLWPLFRLPSLRALTMIGLLEPRIFPHYKLTPQTWRIAPGSCPIEELMLPDCFINTTNLVMLLDACRTLRIFQYEHRDERSLNRKEQYTAYPGSALGSTLGTTKLHYPTIASALERHCHSLENLQLYDDFEKIRPSYLSTGIVGNLQDFKKITYMKGSLGALADVNAPSRATLVENLPRALKSFHLVINWSPQEHHSVSALEHMASYCQTYVPLLEHIHIEAKAHASAFPFSWNKIRKKFYEMGVKMVLNQASNPYSDDDGAEYWLDREVWEVSDESESTSESDFYESDN
ncbi:hypothetical protein K505DRAFT_313636 [Melanomma pulvis-pyrius CBS 109.77]|uniref:F-box domain-containing protein n=1 Tax=Melanomma pulvis-pyrius CBS 109.77 TaxID=1314802 RepID=A0A6A6WY64_9PLEO|nr:hypothetical protein K505DRAFT_313636 [Melanomma pulvis-pyrius CBS 109.77]